MNSRLAQYRAPLIVAVCLLLAFAAIVHTVSVRNGIIFLLGLGLGSALLFGRIGFASSWRQFICKQSSAPLFAQLLLLLIASVACLPLLALVPNTTGNIAPIGISVFVGALLFGIGMQLGDGCGSGTLIGGGGGSMHAITTLVFFIAGSLIGSLHIHWWLPLNWSPVSVVALPLEYALALQTVVIGLVALAVFVIAKSKKIPLALPTRRNVLGIAAIALLMAATLFITGRMWGITFGYTLWGAKMAQAAGVDIASAPFWQWEFPAYALSNSVLTDTTSLMNFGILAAAAIKVVCDTSTPKTHINTRQLMAAILGGLLMGYGARLGFGCNIGAYLSGVASGSLHAWLWLVAAFIGSMIGIKGRTWFAMA